MALRDAGGLVTLGEEGKDTEESLPALRMRMAKVDGLCAEEGRDLATLRRCYFAGWANEPIFASVDATAHLVGRYVEAGATDFTFYLHNPAEPTWPPAIAWRRAISWSGWRPKRSRPTATRTSELPGRAVVSRATACIGAR